jgi:hypothetical protein
MTEKLCKNCSSYLKDGDQCDGESVKVSVWMHVLGMEKCKYLILIVFSNKFTWKLNLPPKSCMPSRAKITMNRKRRKSNEMIERME